MWQSVGVAARGCGKCAFYPRETYVFHMCCFGGGVCLPAARQDGATEVYLVFLKVVLFNTFLARFRGFVSSAFAVRGRSLSASLVFFVFVV